jgi:hypothetical protein
MGKKKNLTGLPNSLEQRYFSTMFYYQSGYMADWIWNAAKKYGVTEIEIDILNDTVTPSALQIKPIIAQLESLRETIQKTLLSNGFEMNFITDAKFHIKILSSNSRDFTCIPKVTDRDNKIYTGKTYTETAMEDQFVF